MEARRILTIIKYNNKDISADISKYLKSISYTDNLSGEADDLQITLEDKAGLWQSTWMPEKGALLDVMLQQNSFSCRNVIVLGHRRKSGAG